MGDSCCASYSIGYVAKLISDSLGVYVHSIATGDGAMADVSSSFFGNVNDQVAKVCDEISETPELQGGYNAVGFSQGGQFMRAVVERCQGGKHGGARMHTLVTMGAQHQGIYNLPNCGTNEDDPGDEPSGMCLTIQRAVATGAYLPFIRDNLIQAQYFKDPFRLEEYLTANPFLPDINNEGAVKNATYADNLASLKRLVLYRFEDEYTVVPRGSEWFDFFDGQRLVNMSDTALYKEDWIGLRRLDEAGRVVRGQVPDALHMHFTDHWFVENVVERFLRGRGD
jgi:palmitoyl-protein thioesterase